MIGFAPCKGCADRHPACHGSCKRYSSWASEYHAEQWYTKNSQRILFSPMTAAKEKALRRNLLSARDHIYGRGK